jgi:hypothetical protein
MSQRSLRRSVGLLFLAGCLLLPGRALADDTVWEFWPEIDFWVQLPRDVRLSSFIALSRREVTDYREGTFILQADYAWKTRKIPGLRRRLADEARAAEMKPMMVRGGYLSGRSLDDDGAEYSERSGLLEFHLRTPLKGGILLSSRLRTDLRFLGEDHDFSWRLRYRMMAEGEFTPHDTSVVPYASVEAYYDSRYSKISRTRVIGGASVGFSRRYALEGNLTYQFESESSPSRLGALNVILHIHF